MLGEATSLFSANHDFSKATQHVAEKILIQCGMCVSLIAENEISTAATAEQLVVSFVFHNVEAENGSLSRKQPYNIVRTSAQVSIVSSSRFSAPEKH